MTKRSFYRALLLGAAILATWAVPTAAEAGGDPRFMFNPREPAIGDYAPKQLSGQQIEAALSGKTWWDTDIQDRFVFSPDRKLSVQPLIPTTAGAFGEYHAGKWDINAQGFLCLTIDRQWAAGGLSKLPRCLRVFEFNKMLLITEANDPSRLVWSWNTSTPRRFVLDRSQHQLYYTRVLPQIINSENAGNKAPPSSSMDKWNTPSDRDMLALHRNLQNATITTGHMSVSHAPDGQAVFTFAGRQTPGRWWISGRNYCVRFAPAPLPPRTFCSFATGLEYGDRPLFFGRFVLTMPQNSMR